MKSETKHTSRNNGILIASGLVVLFTTIFFSSLSSTPDSSVDHTANKSVWSGPFAINKNVYHVDELLFFTVNGIPSNEYGEAQFIGPDGQIHHKVLFDGIKSPTLNHYFTPVPKEDVENCIDCDLIGQWTVSFRMSEGQNYPPILFDTVLATQAEEVKS